jgi:signal transduction histidine kinase
MKGKIFLTVLCIVVWEHSSGQQFSLRKYTAIDGLPQSEVRAMVEDKNGYLWVATQGGGLARFDGREFKVYTTLDGLLSNIVTTLLIDTRNNIWMAHPRGITKFDGRSFTKFVQPTSSNGARRIRRIFQHGDSVFFVSHPGLLGKIYSDSVYTWGKPLVEGKSIFFTHVKPGRSIVHYMNDSSFVYFIGGSRKTISHKNIFGPVENIFSMGSEVIFRSGSGYFQLDMIGNQFLKKDIEPKGHIIYYDSANKEFWTREENKLFKEKLVGKKNSRLQVYDGALISQVLPDEEGNTWIGSLGDGLIRHFNQDFNRCGSDKLKLVMAIAEDHDGAMWIGAMNSGLRKMFKGKIEKYEGPKNSYEGISIIEVGSNGSLFVASKSGLGIFNKTRNDFDWKGRADGLSTSYISSLEADDKGGLWIGTALGGINYFDGNKILPWPDDVNLKSRSIASLKYLPILKTLFIGTDYGLSVLGPNGQIKNIALPEFDNTVLMSLDSYRDSLLLVGSGGAGFAVYDAKSERKKTFTPKDGLSSGFVFFVASDDQDRIWVGTVNGISRIKLNEKWEIVESLHYGFDNGLIGIETNQNAYYFGKDGEKYFGLIDGLYQFNDLKAEKYKSFDTHLTDIEILFDQESIEKYGNHPQGFFKIPDQLSVPHKFNHLTFHFNRVDKRNPNSVRYKYFLENFDKTWSNSTTANSVTYGSLPSGEYVFKVMATNKSGNWESEPLSYSFVVLTPFYQTAWFVGLVILVGIASVLFSVMYRIRSRVSKAVEMERIRHKEQESLRKEIARDFHDEMGNQLTRIINYVSLLKLSSNGNGHSENGHSGNGILKEKNGSADSIHRGNGTIEGHSNERLGDLFNKVEAAAKHLYTGTRDFIWAIDPVNDELSQLFIHLRDFGVKLFEEKNINFRANNTIREPVILPYGFSREANFIFKEAMTNAFKHSQANNVMLSMKMSGNKYELALSDDGVGFDYTSIKVNGLRNIHGRAEKIKANLRVEGGPENGTVVNLSFNIDSKQSQYVKF